MNTTPTWPMGLMPVFLLSSVLVTKVASRASDKVFWLKTYISGVCQTPEQSKLTCTELETWAGMST